MVDGPPFSYLSTMRLGLHLILGFIFSLLALAVFSFLAHNVVREGDLTRIDHEVSQTLEEHGKQHPEIRTVLRTVTEFGGPLVLTGGTLLVVLVLVMKRHHLLALVWMIAVAGGAMLNEVLKIVFERQRPRFAEPLLQLRRDSYSFPSGHAMGSLVFYGFLAYLLVLGMPRRWERWAIVGVLGILVLAIGLSRLYLGAHWPTDVVAGYAAAAIWLSCCISAVETVRRRRAV
jgi:membrane-associated phospholipid phosphatase